MTGHQVSAQIVQPDLLSAASFSVLAGSTVTNTGSTVIGPPVGAPALGGNVGLSPGIAVVGFPPGLVVAPGTIHATNAVALQAKAHLVTTYNTLVGEAPCAALPAIIGDLTLTPGVYCFTTSALFTTPSVGLTLDLLGNPNSLFVFQIPSTLTTQPNYAVSFINGNGGSPCNVWWQVGTSATLDTNTQFVGNILALNSITLNTGTTMLPGRALARNGAVTLDTNTINLGGCVTSPATSTPTNTPVPTNTPAPTNTPTHTPTSTPTNTPVPTATLIPLPPSVEFLPATGQRTDYRPSMMFIGGLFLLASGTWVFSRRPKFV